MFSTPRPRSSMWKRVRSGDTPTSRSPIRFTSTTSSGPKPGPIPLSPRIRTPSPKTSSSTECRCSRVASRSSRNADSSLMKGVDSSGVTSTGMPRASAADKSSGAGEMPFVTTKQLMRQRHSLRSTARRSRAGSLRR
jgi:hypothetical protein